MKRVLPFLLIVMAVCGCKKEYNYYNTYVTNVDSIYTSYYYQTVLNNQQEVTDDVRPDYLKAGDTIGVFALSNAVTQSDLVNGIEKLKSWGLVVVELVCYAWLFFKQMRKGKTFIDLSIWKYALAFNLTLVPKNPWKVSSISLYNI